MKTLEETKVKFTPGPWKAETVSGVMNHLVYCRITSKNFEHPGGIAYTAIPLKGKTKKQKELAGIYNTMGDQVAQWNAKLIAVAPDLLFQVQQAKTILEIIDPENPAIKQMDAVIKKATA